MSITNGQVTRDHVARSTTVHVLTVDQGHATARIESLAGEEPLQIMAAGPDQAPVEVAVTMRTPGHEADLAMGFLITEGLAAPDDIISVTAADPAHASRPDDSVVVHLRAPLDLARIAERRTVATASCGICGRASIDDIVRRCEPIPDGPSIDRLMLPLLPARLRTAQETFESTGGLHASGLFDTAGALVLLREDVGRHNALDKVIGASAAAGTLPLHRTILLLSGRVSFELVQKAAAAGIPVLAAVGAPTDLAVDTALAVGMTLVGFLRGDRYNVYSRADRLGLGG
jgi:FdhD protein